MHHKQGYRIPVSIRVSPIFDEHRTIIGGVELFTDHSSRVSILRELEHLKKQELVDPLVDGGNRTFAEIILHEYLHNMRTRQILFGVLLVDINHLKRVNDTYGHDIGNDVVVMVASALSDILRKIDVIARWGEDKFVVIVANINGDLLETIAERIRSSIEKSWLMYGDLQEVEVTVSVGGTMVQPEDTVTSLFERVEQQMKHSKKIGSNRIVVDAE
jgi:diguanylate cyclase (GGDEF)-like protein